MPVYGQVIRQKAPEILPIIGYVGDKDSHVIKISYADSMYSPYRVTQTTEKMRNSGVYIFNYNQDRGGLIGTGWQDYYKKR